MATPSKVAVGNMSWDTAGSGYVLDSDGSFTAMDSRFDLPLAHGSVGVISREGSRILLAHSSGAAFYYADLNSTEGWIDVTANYP